jgi:hypothetical protein
MNEFDDKALPESNANPPKGQQQAERAARAARVAAALRANLLKRKQQARARSAGGAALPDGVEPVPGSERTDEA